MTFQPDLLQLYPNAIELSLYIHMPWCVRKCPYCDFNSHELPDHDQVQSTRYLPDALEQRYIDALLDDFKAQLPLVGQRSIQSIFIGGGTPSLVSPAGYHRLLTHIQRWAVLHPDCEITMEANPGTLEHAPFSDYLTAGINRLSIGVQSFDARQLKQLGRIHDPDQALNAIAQARAAGFNRLNVDLMHGLVDQTANQAVADLEYAIQAGATHLSWYQLTIEPNTVFYRSQPLLPDEDELAHIQSFGEQTLIANGFQQYEVSAWTTEQQCRHNVNYWQFGDYIAIGAGAHGKLTQHDGIFRYQKSRQPKDYLASTPAAQLNWTAITAQDRPFEFMLNALRLLDGVPIHHYETYTGLAYATIQPIVDRLRAQQLMVNDTTRLQCTPQGMRFLNTVLESFLAEA